MIYLMLIVACLASTGIFAGQGAEYVNSYFELWLKDHKYDGFEKRTDNVYFRDNGIVLDGEIYGVNELDKDQRYSVETRLSVKFPGGRQLDEFVAGIGAKPDEAFLDSLNNFCLTTLHPIYAEIADKDDPHVQKEKWKIGKFNRNIFFSDWGFWGEKLSQKTQSEIKLIISNELRSADLSKEIHWAKLVVSNIKGKTETLVFTIDGIAQDKINGKLSSYNWPQTNEFYMAKFIFVIGKV